MAANLSAQDHISGVLAGDRVAVARAITLMESSKPDHRALAATVLAGLLPHAGSSLRVGISGPPGAGKSTFVEALGMRLVDAGHRVAVLAIDPSSTRTGGSILGDKTRMNRLATDPRAFVRPSPSGGTLGGVHRRTRESMRVLEAAGFDVVLIETVGVGQSEIEVADMVDTFLVLLIGGAGDELQGIKKGILEVADVLAVNKADGDKVTLAELARREIEAALRFVTPRSKGWTPPVLTCSAVTGDGLAEVWAALEAHRAAMTATGEFDARRKAQRVSWMWAITRDELLRSFREDPRVAACVERVEASVTADTESPVAAAEELLRAWRRAH